MSAYRVDFTTTAAAPRKLAPLVTEAADSIDLAMNIGDYVNHLSHEVIGGDVHDDMRSGYLLGEQGENYGTFTVTRI